MFVECEGGEDDGGLEGDGEDEEDGGDVGPGEEGGQGVGRVGAVGIVVDGDGVGGCEEGVGGVSEGLGGGEGARVDGAEVEGWGGRLGEFSQGRQVRCG